MLSKTKAAQCSVLGISFRLWAYWLIFTKIFPNPAVQVRLSLGGILRGLSRSGGHAVDGVLFALEFGWKSSLVHADDCVRFSDEVNRGKSLCGRVLLNKLIT